MAKKRSTSTRSTKRSGSRSSSRKTTRSGRPASANKRESGNPGGGQGRVDQVGRSGVYPRDAENIPGGAEVRMAGQWGGGDYNEAGGSGLIYRDGMVLGGLTAGPDGEPTIDIHGNVLRPRLPEHTEDRTENEK
jgi:hypothetical protein